MAQDQMKRGYGLLAGLAGGVAEIAVVSAYTAATGGDPESIARQVAAAAGLGDGSASLGVAVHMLLAVGLGAVLCTLWTAVQRRTGARLLYPFMLASLALVWTINFFVVLPVVSPAFVHLLPYAVTLASKLAFGAAAAGLLQWRISAAPLTPRAVGQPLAI